MKSIINCVIITKQDTPGFYRGITERGFIRQGLSYKTKYLLIKDVNTQLGASTVLTRPLMGVIY